MPEQSTVWESTSPLTPTSVPDTVQNSLPILSQPNLSPYIESSTLNLETLHLSTSRLKDEDIIPENIPDIQAFPTLSLPMVPDIPVPDITQPGSHSPPLSKQSGPYRTNGGKGSLQVRKEFSWNQSGVLWNALWHDKL